MGETEILVFIILISVAILAFVVVTVALVLQYRKRKIIYENDKRIAAEFHNIELMSVKMEVQEETMQHIGIEIHDSIAQKLTLASLHLQKTEYENKYNELNDTLILSSSLINESLDDLRLLSRRLLKRSEEQIDIVNTLQTECKRVAQLKICHVEFQSDCSGLSLNTEIVHTFLRIVQELIQNSLKHSSCKSITVIINNSETNFSLSIKDDGIGFNRNDALTRNGSGLKNIEKRAAIIGAKMMYESIIGKGTQFSFILPYQNL